MQKFFSLGLLLLFPLFHAALSGEEAVKVETHRFEPIDTSRDRTVPVKAYLKPGPTARPIVIFSHGLGGSRENSVYLGNHWANHGYVAIFVQHPGSDEEVWKSAGIAERMSSLKKAANLSNTLARYADIPFVIDQLEKWQVGNDHPLKGKLDLEHIGLCGHSFGAVTTQGLMGQKFPLNRSFHDQRIDAFFAMSPSITPSMSPERSFGHIAFPVLCMTGTGDDSPITPATTPASRREVYTALPAGDKYQLVFEGGEHMAFSDTALYDRKRQPHHHPAIQEISTRFWDAYLKGDAAAKAWLQSEKPRGDCHLIPKDVWEWK